MKTTEEIMDLLKENPTWDAANEVAKFIFPGFDMLTIPAQGIVIGSLMLDGEDILNWNYDEIYVLDGDRVRVRPSYDVTLAYAKSIVKMHMNWGVEK